MNTPYAFVDNSGTELRRVDESELEAMAAVGYHIAKQHTCVISKEGTHPSPIGSGTLVRIDSTLFVATAKHLFEGFEPDDLIGVYWGPDDNRTGAVIKSIVVDEDLDIAAIPLPPNTPACGWPIDRENISPEHDPELFILSGIPTERCDIDHSTRSLYVGHLSLGCIALPPTSWPRNPVTPIRPNVDLLLNYTRRYATDSIGNSMSPVSPFGMSGGGIWSVPRNTNTVWTPEHARLVAIQSSVESDRWQYLRATRIESWIRMLSR